MIDSQSQSNFYTELLHTYSKPTLFKIEKKILTYDNRYFFLLPVVILLNLVRSFLVYVNHRTKKEIMVARWPRGLLSCYRYVVDLLCNTVICTRISVNETIQITARREIRSHVLPYCPLFVKLLPIRLNFLLLE